MRRWRIISEPSICFSKAMAAMRRSLRSSIATTTTVSGSTPRRVSKPGGMGWVRTRTFRARHIDSSFKGLKFDIQAGKQRIEIDSRLIGRINVYNILAAVGAGLSYGIPGDVISRGIQQCTGIPGRFERVDEGQPFAVVVDYSHTDDALRNALTMARGLGSKRILTVFGCGGDRDRSKRPLMGKAAGELSDYVVLTSDNPRSEDPLQIMNDANVGLQRTESKHVFEPDREAESAGQLRKRGRGILF